MLYTAYLEMQDDGSTMAHVPALPGCISTGLTAELAVARLPEAVRSYHEWLRRHGEQAPGADEPIQIEIGTVAHDAYPGAASPDSTFALLPPDRQALDEAEVGQLLQLLAHSRQDLLELLTGLTPEILNWQPSGPDDQPAWSIEDVVEHIARAERFLTSRLTANPMAMLQEARKAAVERIAALDEKQLNQVIEHQNEYWTARKVLRRLLEHEREHARHVEQILARLRASQGLL